MLIYNLVVFLCGAALMALEILGSRILAPAFGNSVFVWGSLITTILAALSGGYALGGKMADRRPKPAPLGWIIFIGAILSLILVFISTPVNTIIQDLMKNSPLAPLVAALILFFPPAFLMGMVSPFVIRLASSNVEEVGSVAGRIYALSTVGSIAGTLLTTFIIIPNFSVSASIIGVGCTLLLAFLLLPSSRKPIPLICVLLLGALTVTGYRAMTHREAAHPEEAFRTIHTRDSAYHHIIVMEDATSRVLRFDNLVQGWVEKAPPHKAKTHYTRRFHLGFLLNPTISRTLFIGLGTATGPNAFRRLYPSMAIDTVEIDPAVLKVAERYFYFTPDPLLTANVSDGRIYLQRASTRWDYIVLDTYYADSIPYHLMTREFFQEVSKHLTSGGCLGINLLLGNKITSDQLFKATVKTLRTVFPEIYIFPVGDVKPGQVGNVFIIASQIQVRISRDTLIQRAATWKEKTGLDLPLDTYAGNLYTGELDLGKAPIFTDEKNSSDILRLLSLWGVSLPTYAVK